MNVNGKQTTNFVSRSVKREERDAAQRRAAKERYKAVRKALPKEVRERDVRKERLAQSRMLSGYTGNEVEQQSGKLLMAGVSAGVLGIVGALAKKLGGHIDKTSNAINSVIDEVKKTFLDVKAKLVSAIGNIWVIPVLALAFWLLSRVISPLVRALLIPIFAMVFGVYWLAVKPAFHDIEEQSEGGVLSAAICSALTMIYLPKDATKLPGEILRRLSTLPRAAEGVETFVKGILAAVETVVNYILKLAGKEQIAFGDETHKQVKAWVSEAEAVEVAVRNMGSAEPDLAIIQRLERVIMDGLTLRSVIGDVHLKSTMQRVLDRLEVKKRPFASALAATKTFRVEPLFVLLVGGPGQGKTVMLTRIASVMLLLSGQANPQDVLQNLWQKGDSKYWESYFGQKCVVMDDCFQEKAVPGMDTNEFLQIIKTVGCWACPLNMATLEDKGKFFFNSPLIIGTTNAKGIKSTTAGEVIHDIEAVARRIRHAIEVKASEEWSTTNEIGLKVLDYPKLERFISDGIMSLSTRAAAGEQISQMDVIDVFPWHAWTVNKVNPLNGEVVDNDIDLKTFIFDCAKDLKNRIANHEKALKGLHTFNQLLASATPIDITSSGVEMQAGKFRPGHDLTKHALQEGVLAEGEIAAELDLNGQSPDLPLVDDDMCRLAEVSYVDFHNELEEARVARLQTVSEAESFRTQMLQFVAGFAVVIGLQISFKLVTSKLLRTAISKVFGFILGLVLSVKELVCFALEKLLRVFGIQPKVEEQSNVVAHKITRPKFAKKYPSIVEQSGFDGSQDEQKHSKVYANTYKMLGELVDGSVYEFGQVVMLVHKAGMLPQHFLHNIQKMVADGRITPSGRLHFIKCDNTANKTSMPYSTFMALRRVKMDGADLEVVDFGKTMNNAAKTIVQLLFEAKELDDFLATSHAVRLDVCKATTPGSISEVSLARHTILSPRAWYLPQLTFPDGGSNKGVVGYKMDTACGMCGAPLMASSPKYYKGHVLIGIHVAGTLRMWDKEGYAIPLTREAADAALKKLNIVSCSLEEDMAKRGIALQEADVELQAGLVESGLVAGSFELLGTVEHGVNLAPNSKIQPTMFNDMQIFGDCGQKPAHLKPVVVDGELKYPMVEGVRNYQTEVQYFSLPNISVYIDLATLPLRKATMHDFKGLLTFEEAVTTREGLKLKPINRNTSAGYPYSLYVTGGKKEFFGCGEEYEFSSPACEELRQRVEHVVTEAKRGVRLAHICTDFLKDETRPYAKVDAVATRIIAASPLDYVVACRMYFGAFMAACFRNNIDTGLAPGINPYSEWWRLANFLLGKERTKCFDGDFKRFDASEQPCLLEEILDFINRWYGDSAENQLVRRVLWLDLTHSRHLTGLVGDVRYVVQWNKSLPSGHPLTTIVNSLYSLITLTACYCTLTGDVRDMWSRVAICVYGDDNLNSVDDDLAEVFNQATVTKAMKELFSLDYTRGDKKEGVILWKPLTECVFLQRGFLEEPDGVNGGWSAPLREQSFLFPAYWCKNKRDIVKITVNNLQGTLGELSLHAENLWDMWFPKVKQALMLLGEVPLYDTREAWRRETYAREDFWH